MTTDQTDLIQKTTVLCKLAKVEVNALEIKNPDNALYTNRDHHTEARGSKVALEMAHT